MLKYKGYTGKIEPDFDAMIIHGQVIDLTDVLTFRGESLREVEADFRHTIDDYLELCKELGKTPQRPFSGTLSIRVPPELHKRIAIRAASESKSINQWLIEACENYLRPSSQLNDEQYIVSATGDLPLRHNSSVGKNKKSDTTADASFQRIGRTEMSLNQERGNGKAKRNSR
ncbi:MAG: type II toxin-antitoxin system HicB family antitoxin [Bacteroidota bacterium]